MEIQSWGFPTKVAQLQEMAKELLQTRHNFKELGKSLNLGFLNRHSVLRSKYICTLDQDQFLAQNRD